MLERPESLTAYKHKNAKDEHASSSATAMPQATRAVHCHDAEAPRAGDRRAPAAAASDERGVSDRQESRETTHKSHKKRDKFVLPLATTFASNNSSSQKHSCERDSSGTPHVERHAKSFKDEPWYTSPVGFGSKASVVLSALAQRDVAGSGFLHCHDVIEVLQAPNFGLTEFQVRSLISRFDSTLHDDSAVHYTTFARTIQFLQGAHAPDDSDHERSANDVLFRHQTYVAKIREHANRLAQKLPHDGHGHDSSTSPRKEADQGVLAGSDVAYSALSVIHTASPSLASPTRLPATSPDKREDVDRLSFEFDKQRRVNRMAVKASTLLTHINRIEAVTKHEQMLHEQHDALRLAAKALHRHNHYARLLETETHDMRMLEKQCKGLVRSELTRMNHNVSKDSMFYIKPT